MSDNIRPHVRKTIAMSLHRPNPFDNPEHLQKFRQAVLDRLSVALTSIEEEFGVLCTSMAFSGIEARTTETQAMRQLSDGSQVPVTNVDHSTEPFQLLFSGLETRLVR